MAHSQIPPGFLNVYELGQPRQYFAGSRPRARWQLWLGWLLILVGLTSLVWGLWLVRHHSVNYGPANSWEVGGLPVIVGCGLVLAALAWFLLTQPRRCVDFMVYEQGLGAARRNDLVLWYWPDFTSLTLDREHRIFLGITFSTRQRYLLVDKTGNRLEITDCTQGVEALLEIIKENVLPRLLERSQQSFLQGHSLRFGQIELRRGQGLRVNEIWFSWGQIQKIWVDKGFLWLQILTTQGSKESKIAVRNVANLEVLLALVGSQGILKAEETLVE